jgi:hypothetical protein
MILDFDLPRFKGQLGLNFSYIDGFENITFKVCSKPFCQPIDYYGSKFNIKAVYIFKNNNFVKRDGDVFRADSSIKSQISSLSKSIIYQIITDHLNESILNKKFKDLLLEEFKNAILSQIKGVEFDILSDIESLQKRIQLNYKKINNLTELFENIERGLI